jgi:branched-chain amino acid transport system ATP-binding protein
VYPGELHAIIGPNGAGKTTLLNLLTGILPLDGGTILFMGSNISSLAMHRRQQRGMARTFQITNVFKELTVYENVRIAVQAGTVGGFTFFKDIRSFPEIRDRTLGILEEMELHEYKDLSADSLSHGDQRRLELAIAIASRPKILLLDEPTAGISPKDVGRATDLILKTSEKVTILMIEHNMDVVMTISDVITVMQLGRTLVEGTPEEIKENPEVKAAYLGE